MQTIREYLREQGKLKESKELQEAFKLGVPGTGKDPFLIEEIKTELQPEKELIINAADYKWVRILPDDFYEDGVDAIWCHKEDTEDKPVEINDRVEYSRYSPYKYPGPSALGKVIAIFESIGQVDKRYTYYANKYDK